jgi:rubredoxin
MANEQTVKRWICTICGHIYDPAQGEPKQGIPPGRAFEDLPEDWVCPVCGAGKSLFKEI